MTASRDYRDYLEDVNVNLEVVWKTVAEDLPALLPQIQHVLDETAE